MNGRKGERDRRGNNRDRKRRKLWLLSVEAPFGGDGETVPCVHCQRTLTYRTVEADRKEPGGSYRRENVQPSCRTCNAKRGKSPEWVPDEDPVPEF